LAPYLLDDLRTNFITLAANGYATMHYNISRIAIDKPCQIPNSCLENPGCDPAPPGVEEGHRPATGMGKVDGDAVRNRYGECQTGPACEVSIEAIE